MFIRPCRPRPDSFPQSFPVGVASAEHVALLEMEMEGRRKVSERGSDKVKVGRCEVPLATILTTNCMLRSSTHTSRGQRRSYCSPVFFILWQRLRVFVRIDKGFKEGVVMCCAIRENAKHQSKLNLVLTKLFRGPGLSSFVSSLLTMSPPFFCARFRIVSYCMRSISPAVPQLGRPKTMS
jgi:hypothetical protein